LAAGLDVGGLSLQALSKARGCGQNDGNRRSGRKNNPCLSG